MATTSRCLRSDKVKQISVLVAEDEYVTDVQSAMVCVDNEWILSSSSVSEGVLDEQTWIDRYTSRFR